MKEIKYTVQAVILNDKGEVLSVSRKDDHNDMGLVGGKVDPEDFEHDYPLEFAMRRGCLEETGITIDMNTSIEVFRMHKDGHMGVTYLIKDWSGEIETDEPHIVKWTSFNEVIDGSFGKWNKLVLDSLISLGVPFKMNK